MTIDLSQKISAILAGLDARMQTLEDAPSSPPATLTKMAAGVNRVKAGGARSVIAMIGDSLTAGWGAGAATGTGNGSNVGSSGWRRDKSWPHKLAALLTAANIPSRSDAFFPCAFPGAPISEVAGANPNISFASSWSLDTQSNPTLSGGFVSSGSAGPFTFTPELSANRFDIFITGLDGLGQFTVSDASGTLATISQSTVGTDGVQGSYGSAPASFRKVTVQRSASSLAPISIQWTGGSVVFINGIIPYDTASPRVELLNMGWPNAKCSDWQTTQYPWTPFSALGIFNGYIDGTIIELGANDANAGVSASEYQSRLQAIADKVSPYGDVWIAKAHKALDAGSSINMPGSYLTAMDAVQASKNSTPPLNFNALSLVTADYYDNIHASEQGYAKEASAAATAFHAAVGVA